MRTLLVQITLDVPNPSATYGHSWLDPASRQTLPSIRHAPLALLPRPGRREGVWAMVPACALSWHRVQLPAGLGRSASRVQAALAGLLEDRLLEDTARLHLALPARWTSGEATWVAVCDKAWLQAHLQALHEAGLRVQRIVPLQAPAPDAPTLQPAGDDTADGTQHWPQALASDWNLAQFELQSRLRMAGSHRLPAMAQALLSQPQWRATRWGLLALLVAQLAGWNAWAWTTRRHWQAQEDQWTTVLQQSFPHIQVVVDAPLQMAREVTRLQRQAGELGPRDLETQLRAMGTALPPGVPGPSRLSYQDGVVQWPAPGMSAAQKTAFEQALHHQGYDLQPQGELWRLQVSEQRERAQ
jgi:general secretion pathway protein L